MSNFVRIIVTALYYLSKSCIIAMCGTEERRISLPPQVQTLFNTSTVGYTRGHVGDKAGPGPQRGRLTAFCAWNTPPLHTIIDEAPEMVSTPLADRPGGADLLTLLRARISTVVVVNMLDRLSSPAWPSAWPTLKPGACRGSCCACATSKGRPSLSRQTATRYSWLP